LIPEWTNLNWDTLLLEAATEAKRRVTPLIGTNESGRSFGIGAGGDTTRKIDKAAEEAIVDTLNYHKVCCTFVSEEMGTKIMGGESDLFVVTDPVDGTTNALHGIDFYATSIAISDKPSLEGVFYGLVMNLANGEVFDAGRGRGAFHDGKPLKVSYEMDFTSSIIGIDLSGIDKIMLKRVEPIILGFRHLRHFGANSLELCQVASGLTDVFVDIRDRIRATDIAAAYLILKEAGGVVLDPTGKELNIPLTPKSRASLIAGNPKICNLILDKFRITSKIH
jgi:myo-inositol-1(or 4)-monophosphatase